MRFNIDGTEVADDVVDGDCLADEIYPLLLVKCWVGVWHITSDENRGIDAVKERGLGRLEVLAYTGLRFDNSEG